MPFLSLWEQIDFKKVQVEIRHVIEALKQSDELEDTQWERLIKEQATSLLIRLSDPIIMECQQCGDSFICDETNSAYYTSEGLRFPDNCLHYSEDNQRNG